MSRILHVGLFSLLISIATIKAMSTNSKTKRVERIKPTKAPIISNEINSLTNDEDTVRRDVVEIKRNVLFVDKIKRNTAATITVPANPSFVTKLIRRITVFRLAFKIFLDIKLAQRKTKRIQKKLGLNADDDEHPEIVSLWDDVHERNAAKLTLKIKKLEGFWVKIGQYLSSRADVMPIQYLSHLSSLQDSMPPRSWDDTWCTIEESMSEKELEIFESVDPEPLSTASLAQVHRATLKACDNVTNQNESTKKEVVFKVQHRGVSSLMIQDMENLRVILNAVAYFDPDADFSLIINEYNLEVRKELDFRQESRNMDEIRILLQKNNIKAIVPKTLLAKEKVLVMDYCEGFPVRDLQSLDKYKVDRELLLQRVCAAWAVQMHVGGVFNADPHVGNVLVSTAVPSGNLYDDDCKNENASSLSSVPVLLDFRLTKRLDPAIKVAFARLMHSSYETDVDGLIQSFEEMGLKMNRYDPFEDMANMQRGFGETVPQSQAKRIAKEKSESYNERMNAMREDQGLEKKQKLRNPVEAWPSELIFFGRVTNVLKGMCSHLDVRYPYLKTMANAARGTLRHTVNKEEQAIQFVNPSSYSFAEQNISTTALQRRLIDAVEKIHMEGEEKIGKEEDGDNDQEIVGLQFCVIHKGKQVANIAAGTLGKANPRPVAPSTLFNVFSVSKGILSIGLLRLVQENRAQLDDPVSKYWPEFQKHQITIRHVLSHQSGLANAIPEDATLDTLLDWSVMKKHIESVPSPEHEPGTKTMYHYLSYAWICGGIIEAVTNEPYDVFLNQLFSKLDIDLDLFLGGIPKDLMNKDLAVLSMNKSILKEKPSVTNKKLAEKSREKKSRKKVLSKYRGQEQLYNPSVFNMRKVREAKIPSANGHASAESLATVFGSLLSVSHGGSAFMEARPLLSKEIVDLARTPTLTNTIAASNDKGEDNKLQINAGNNNLLLDDAQALFGLGFQTHEFTLPDGKKVRSIGHAGLGGSVVVAIPECQLTIAFVSNQLSFGTSRPRSMLLKMALEEYGLDVPSSLQK